MSKSKPNVSFLLPTSTETSAKQGLIQSSIQTQLVSSLNKGSKNLQGHIELNLEMSRSNVTETILKATQAVKIADDIISSSLPVINKHITAVNSNTRKCIELVTSVHQNVSMTITLVMLIASPSRLANKPFHSIPLHFIPYQQK